MAEDAAGAIAMDAETPVAEVMLLEDIRPQVAAVGFRVIEPEIEDDERPTTKTLVR